MALAPEQAGIGIRRYFTTPGVHPYDELEWERRDARITNWKDGSVAFEQLGVEFPVDWSLNATNIVAQKYFRGTLGTPEREASLRQVADRVVDTITRLGRRGRLLRRRRRGRDVQRRAEAPHRHPEGGVQQPGVVQHRRRRACRSRPRACFILAVDDTMDSILNWYKEEGTIFKGGSGAGVNLSRIRSSVERLKGGGTASGPVSFMRGADASAGTIKTGGKTRRAAKMVILDVDHPDVEEFIWVKAREEQKIRVLRDAGFEMDLDGRDMASVQYQNANNSVRVTDEFMRAVEADADWHLRAVTTARSSRRSGPATSSARSPWPRGSAPIPACSSTRRSTTGTRRQHRSDQRLEPVQRVHAPRQLGLQPRLAQPAEVPRATAMPTPSTSTASRPRSRSSSPPRRSSSAGPTTRPRRSPRRAGRFRQLGLGYANLGALLMALGLPYDSAGGRAWAGAITALMTGHAYEVSARTAARMGPFAGYGENREHMLRVLDQHRQAAAGIDEELVPADLLSAAQSAWDSGRATSPRSPACATPRRQCSAPTGTIGLMMDCDTTGIEPDLGLVKMKKLVGGGTMSIVNQTCRGRCAGSATTPTPIADDRRLHRRAQVDPRCPAPRPTSTCPCSPAPWATTRSTTWATSR